MKKVLVFGVFDTVHPGHLHFLESAAALGDELIVAVARDSTVLRLKNKVPREDETARMEALLSVEKVSRVKLGDEELGTYQVLRDEKPDIIALGYDQKGLHADLLKKVSEGHFSEITLVVLNSHEPERFKSSLLG